MYPDLFKSFWTIRQVLHRHHGCRRHGFISRVYEGDEQVDDLVIVELGPGTLIASQKRIQHVILSATGGPPVSDHLPQHCHKLLPCLKDNSTVVRGLSSAQLLSDVFRYASSKQYLKPFAVVGSWDVDWQGEGAKYKGVQLCLEGIREWASRDAGNLPEC
jgi:hypothetical protein